VLGVEHPPLSSAEVGTKQSCTSTTLFRAFMTYCKEKQKNRSIRGVVGFRTCLDAAEKKEIACFSQESKFDVSVFPYITQSLYEHSYLGFTKDNIYLENYRKVEI
jgi:hypothetical protein